MAEGKSNTKKIAFVVTVLAVLLALYWFVVRPKLKASGYFIPKDPIVTAARAQYESQMMAYLQSDDANAKAWYATIKANLNGATPSNENLLGSIRAAAQAQEAEFIFTRNGILEWRGPVKTLYGF